MIHSSTASFLRPYWRIC